MTASPLKTAKQFWVNYNDLITHMRNRYYSGQQRENLKKAIVYLVITVGVVLIFLYIGVPTLAKLALTLGGNGGQLAGSDTNAPAPPRLVPISEYTSEELISIKGFTEAKADIELFVNGESVKSVLSDDSGEFLLSDVKIASGSNQLYVTAKDESGNVSQPSGNLRVVLDTILPELSVENPKDGERFVGQDKKTIRVNGQSETDVKLTLNGRFVQTNDEGKFDTTLTLNDGEQEIMFLAIDKAGNKLEKNVKVTFVP